MRNILASITTAIMSKAENRSDWRQKMLLRKTAVFCIRVMTKPIRNTAEQSWIYKN